MTSPSSDRIDDVATELDGLATAVADAYNELSDAEAEWDEKYDQVAETLRDEARDRGMKTDPGEHTIVAATRREHRSAYTRLRRAKREVAKLELISQNRRAELSGLQTLKREGGEVRQLHPRGGPRSAA